MRLLIVRIRTALCRHRPTQCVPSCVSRRSTHFGGGIVIGAIFGGVCHGIAAERLTKCFGVRGEGSYGEARVLSLLITGTMLAGGLLLAILSR